MSIIRDIVKADTTTAEIDLNEMREASALAIQVKGKILSGDSDV